MNEEQHQEEESIDLTRNTQTIEDSHIAPSTHDAYVEKLVGFMIYLYNNQPELIVDKNELTISDALDTTDYARKVAT